MLLWFQTKLSKKTAPLTAEMTVFETDAQSEKGRCSFCSDLFSFSINGFCRTVYRGCKFRFFWYNRCRMLQKPKMSQSTILCVIFVMIRKGSQVVERSWRKRGFLEQSKNGRQIWETDNRGLHGPEKGRIYGLEMPLWLRRRDPDGYAHPVKR